MIGFHLPGVHTPRRVGSQILVLRLPQFLHALTQNSKDLENQSGTPMECGLGGQPHKTPHFHPQHRHQPRGNALARRAWVRLNYFRTGVGRFRSCLCKWGMASAAACECGAEEQTVDHVVLQCPIHRPQHGLHGLMVLDDETME